MAAKSATPSKPKPSMLLGENGRRGQTPAVMIDQNQLSALLSSSGLHFFNWAL
jgi:hypothetical protein